MAWTHISEITLTLAVIQCAFLTYGIVYRLFLSPVAKIPGPKLAALTSWYEVYYDIIKPGKYVWKIKDLHDQCGPILRIAPNEVHVKDLGFLDTIYAPATRRREKEVPKNLEIALSVAGTANHELHKQRRDALNPFFSKRSVVNLGPMITEKIGQLCAHLDKAIETQKPINLSDLYYAFAIEQVLCLTCYSFASDNDILGDLEQASNLRRNLTRLLLGVKFRTHFLWVVNLTKRLPVFLGKFFVPPGIIDMIRFSRKIRGEIQHVMEDVDRGEIKKKHSIFYDLLRNPSLAPSEKTLPRIEQEGSFLVMAGTDSTAKSICITHYYLLANPSMLSKVRAELRTLSNPNTASFTQLEQLPYLNAVIAERNRLSFGLTKRNCRVAPDEALQYNDYTIPAGTPVSMTSLCVHLDEEVFPDPWAFKPERWLGPEGATARRYQFAFGRGPRKYLGINLAHAELYLVIAAVAWYDMKLYKTDESDVKFQHDYQIAHPKLDSQGIRTLILGREASL